MAIATNVTDRYKAENQTVVSINSFIFMVFPFSPDADGQYRLLLQKQE